MALGMSLMGLRVAAATEAGAVVRQICTLFGLSAKTEPCLRETS
jgi:hypothetical protein